MTEGAYVMRIVELADGSEPFVRFEDGTRGSIAGHWLQAPPSADDLILEVLAVRTTADPAKAFRWPSRADAWQTWAATHPLRPTRPDGLPNRPLTAFTVSIEPEP